MNVPRGEQEVGVIKSAAKKQEEEHVAMMNEQAEEIYKHQVNHQEAVREKHSAVEA